MTHTVIGKYTGTISRKVDGESVQFHHFSDVLKYRPLPNPAIYTELRIPVSGQLDFTPQMSARCYPLPLISSVKMPTGG
jgi:hypothetical protein